MNAKTTSMVFDNGQYFVAHLDNGGVRIGMNFEASFSVPHSHSEYGIIVNLGRSGNADDIEDYFDENYSKFLENL